MEWMKTCCRMNLFSSIAMFMLLVLQVGVLVRVELSGEGDEMMVMAEPEIIFQYAGRYISNLAFTFIAANAVDKHREGIRFCGGATFIGFGHKQKGIFSRERLFSWPFFNGSCSVCHRLQVAGSSDV